jgi:L-aspartate oxidase
MSRDAGVLRSAVSLRDAADGLARLGHARARANTAGWEATNLLTVASALVAAAAVREETRGCHWREDFPEASDDWLGHLLATAAGGALVESWDPIR